MSLRTLTLAAIAGLAILPGLTATPASAHGWGRGSHFHHGWHHRFERDSWYHGRRDRGWYDNFGRFHRYDDSSADLLP